MVGPNVALQTNEDEPVRFVYSIKETLEKDNRDTIDLKISLHTAPKFGELSDCQELEEGLAIECVYTPNANFHGDDKVLFNSKDGDFVSSEQSELSIKVNEVGDAPTSVGDISVSVLQGATVVFDVPLAEDLDSSAGQLQYLIKQSTPNGVLRCFQNDQGNPVIGKRTCSYTPNAGYYGNEVAKYNVKDETNLSAAIDGNINIAVTRQRYSAEEIFNQNQAGNLSSVDTLDQWVASKRRWKLILHHS